MVAMNYQTITDANLHLHSAMFSGTLGYILKPQVVQALLDFVTDSETNLVFVTVLQIPIPKCLILYCHLIAFIALLDSVTILHGKLA